MIEDAAAAREVDSIHADLLGIAGVIPLVKFMTTAKLRSDGIPDQLEELDAIVSGHSSTAVVPIDEGPQVRIRQILAAGGGDKRSTAEYILENRFYRRPR